MKPWLSWEEAIKLVRQRTGKTRRQAIAALIEHARKGDLSCTGINQVTGEREAIPPQAWPALPPEH